MSVPLRLRDLRMRKGLSQQQLADKARLSRVTIVKAERGQTEARPATISALAEALGEPTEVIWSAFQESAKPTAEGPSVGVASDVSHVDGPTQGGAA